VADQFAIQVARHPEVAIDRYHALERRHERLKGAVIDLLGVLDPCPQEVHKYEGALERLREALHAESAITHDTTGRSENP